MSFVAELKRRNVIRVGVAYGVATWLLLQVVDVIAPILELPDWAPKLVLLILVIGLVPVLIFAWVFELTPEGLKRESKVDRGASITRETARKLDYVTIGLLLAVVALIGLDRLLPRDGGTAEVVSAPAADVAVGDGAAERTPAPSGADSPPARSVPPPKSVAVLPFVNMSEDAANEYFSDGISEEILNALAKVKDLKVAGRTSSFAFKGQNQDLRVIADALGVSHILEGSVRKAGNRVRVTAQLIKADDGFHVWSENYDRELDDVFAIQDEISAAILQQLEAHLGGQEPIRAARTDTQAYELYLLAGQRIYERNQASLELAADLLRQAIGIDPGYAPAHAQLATATLLLAETHYGTIPFEQAMDRARTLLEQALDLDPANAEALAGMGLYHISRNDAAEARTWLERAVAVNPSLVNANLWLSSTLSDRGELRRGLEILEASFERDPLHPPTYTNLATSLSVVGRISEARARLADLRRFLPGSASLQGALGKVEVFAGDWAAAHRSLGAAVAAEPLNYVDRLWFSSVLFATRQYALLEDVGAEPWSALALSRLGRTEEALLLSGRAVQKGVGFDFHLQILAENGRFEDLLAYVDGRWPSLDAFEKDSSARDGYGSLGLMLIAQAHGRLDHEDAFFTTLERAREAIRSQRDQGADNWIVTVSDAAAAALAGDRDNALALLEEAAGAGMLPRLDLEGPYSLFEALQGDPRYEAVLQRVRGHLDDERAALSLEPVST